jgi:hypothetical protein
MIPLTLSSLLVVSLAFAQNPPASVQTTDTAVLAELTALRRSVDQLVEVIKLVAQQSADRDSSLVMAQVIDMDERRITQMQQRLDGVVESRAALDREMAQMRGSLDTYTQMAAGDPTGKAQAMMEQEKIRTTEQLEQKANARLQLDSQASQIDGEIANAKQLVLEMRRRLDQKIRLTPQP